MADCMSLVPNSEPNSNHIFTFTVMDYSGDIPVDTTNENANTHEDPQTYANKYNGEKYSGKQKATKRKLCPWRKAYKLKRNGPYKPLPPIYEVDYEPEYEISFSVSIPVSLVFEEDITDPKILDDFNTIRRLLSEFVNHCRCGLPHCMCVCVRVCK